VATVRAAPGIGAGEPGEELAPAHRLGQAVGSAGGASRRLAAAGDRCLPSAVGEQAVGAHSHEAVRQDVEQEAPEEFVGVQAHRALPVAVGPVRADRAR
jgi:hypothetical protein